MEVTRFGKYEVRATIGRGAVGVVYEAWDPLMARTVAIKALPLLDLDEEGTEHYARFKREAQAAARLHHPNIVSAFDYGETDASAYIVMEFLPGPSLKSLLAKREPLELSQIRTIMHGLLAGLQHSHGRGVVHRDIKPANIVFSAEGEVKITDFGVAHLDTSGITRAGSVLGTPAYMAPEQVLGDPVDARTDLFSAGVVLYEMLTGRRPFEGSTSSIMHKIVHLHPPQPSQLAPTISSGIDAIIAKALAKDPDDRYQSATEFDTALQAELTQTPIPADMPMVAPVGEAEITVRFDRTRLSMPATRGPPPSGTADPRGSVLAPKSPPAAARGTWPLLLAGTGVLVAGMAAWLVLAPGAGRHGIAPPAMHPAPPREADATVEPPPPRAAIPVAPPATVTAATPQAQPTAPATTVAKPQPTATSQTTRTAAASPTTPPPAPTQAAADPLQPLREQVRAIAASAPCSFIAGDVATGGKVRLHGVSALGEASELEIQAMLQRAVRAAAPQAAVTWTIQRIDGPYCPVLDLLRSLPHGDAGFSVAVSLPGKHPHLTEGAAVRLAVTVPPHPVRLALDLFAGDGTVHHLHAGPIGGSQPYAVAELRPGKPYGDQVLTAVVTSDTLFRGPRPKQEPAANYLKALQSALTSADAKGIRLAADVLPIGVTAH